MRFTLHYDGLLPARGTAAAKAAIRSTLEPQLKDLSSFPPLSHHEAAKHSQHNVFDRHGHTFKAVVTAALRLSAELDILMLRPGASGGPLHSGDIDNRLKTLFDALSAPAQKNQITPGMKSSTPDHPSYVLLEDDRLISRVNVDTDQLLGPADKDHVRLTIRVATWTSEHIWANVGLA